MFAVVTGGAGFIGSHLVDALVRRGDRVSVIDSLVTGSRDHIGGHTREGRIRFIKADLLKDGWQDALRGADCVFHLAADPDVRQGAIKPDRVFTSNVIASYRVLEAMREHRVPAIGFTSTSTVYGDARVIPTPESYGPLEPVSVYGASKLATESLISAYCHSFGMTAWIYRFANIIGERSNHGVIWDFVHKLMDDPMKLEILGDGRQIKSYLDVHECVAAMLFAAGHAQAHYNVYNIGSEDWIDVTRIATIITEEMGLGGVTFSYTGGERGWVGDVPRMQLSVESLKCLGWRPSIGSEESVRMAARSMVREIVPRSSMDAGSRLS